MMQSVQSFLNKREFIDSLFTHEQYEKLIQEEKSKLDIIYDKYANWKLMLYSNTNKFVLTNNENVNDKYTVNIVGKLSISEIRNHLCVLIYNYLESNKLITND